MVQQLLNPSFGLQPGDVLAALQQGQGYNGSVTLVAHAGGGQAAATPIPAAAMLVNIGTVASDHDSCVLPFAIAGMFKILSAGGHVLDLYGQSATNKLTGAVDTINGVAGSTAYSGMTATTGKNAILFCVVNGAWNIILTSAP